MTVQIQISWLLQKPTYLDLHCLLKQGMTCLEREAFKTGLQWLIKPSSVDYTNPFCPVFDITNQHFFAKNKSLFIFLAKNLQVHLEYCIISDSFIQICTSHNNEPIKKKEAVEKFVTYESWVMGRCASLSFSSWPWDKIPVESENCIIYQWWSTGIIRMQGQYIESCQD